MTTVVRAALTDQPIDSTEHEVLVAHHAAGAVVVFAGVVRDHDGGRNGDCDWTTRRIRPLHRHWPTSSPRSPPTAREFAPSPSAIGSGPCTSATPHLVAAVAADHRRAAFETCARLVDSVKDRLPVWKHQFFADGTDEWVNSA